uniref:Methyltransferase n=2 Tax=Anthurium amnicola TaxID=1678845 RepID=A0A1D1Z7M2_9ARAE
MEAAALVCTAAAVGLGLYWFVWVMGSAEQKGKRAVELRMGSISRDKVQDKYRQYWSFFRRPKEIGESSAEKEKVPAFVDTFYNLVTDIYEWGWGQSFHFSPSLPGRSHRDATRLHEERAATLIGACPGHRILDVGCGVGGPMRAIAAHSRSHVVGITINEYQVGRARAHNRKAGIDDLCEVVCGNFLQMPFPDASFDGAYSIEATCHAPRLEDVYGEIYRVLKPGALYVSYEWVTTPLYRPDDPEHVEVVQGIERGDALPGLRRQDEVADIARSVGFEVLQEEDLAQPPAGPWWTRLKMGRIAYWRNHLVIKALALLGIAPRGVADVHEMLYWTAVHLSRGGDTGIFTPMHMILCRKPLDDAPSVAIAAAEANGGSD